MLLVSPQNKKEQQLYYADFSLRSRIHADYSQRQTFENEQRSNLTMFESSDVFVDLYSAAGLPLSVTDDLDDPLDDLLNQLDEERPKSIPSGKAGKQQSSSPAVQKKEERGQNNILESCRSSSSLQEPVHELGETFSWKCPGLTL